MVVDGGDLRGCRKNIWYEMDRKRIWYQENESMDRKVDLTRTCIDIKKLGSSGLTKLARCIGLFSEESHARELLKRYVDVKP